MHQRADSLQLSRWRAARRISLGVILLSGSMATASISVQRLSAVQPHVVVYSGIGVTITEPREGVVKVVEVNPDGPAQGRIFPGAILIAADGERIAHQRQWKNALRGEPGTDVDVTVRYPGACTHTITLERGVVRAWLP